MLETQGRVPNAPPPDRIAIPPAQYLASQTRPTDG